MERSWDTRSNVLIVTIIITIINTPPLQKNKTSSQINHPLILTLKLSFQNQNSTFFTSFTIVMTLPLNLILINIKELIGNM